MSLGAVIGNAVGALTGTKGGTTLDDFLMKFSSSAGVYVNTIDPLHTFDVTFTFFPSSKAASSDDDPGKEMLNVLKQAGQKALVKLTMGIASALGAKEGQVKTEHDGFKPGKKDSFVNYLAKSILLTSDEDSSAGPLQLNLGLYIQNMSLPQIKVDNIGSVETVLGKFPVVGGVVMPENNTFTATILNTKLPLMEILFYPWMREVTLPYWSYSHTPYTTATVEVDFSKHADIKYIFYGCKPTQIQTYEPTQEADTTITRDVTFTFDFMNVKSTSKYKTQESLKDKLLGAAKGLAGAAGSMLGVG